MVHKTRVLWDTALPEELYLPAPEIFIEAFKFLFLASNILYCWPPNKTLFFMPIPAFQGHPRCLLWVILIVWFVAAAGFQTWLRGEVIRYDASSYYSYLPAVFIRHDLSFAYLKKEDRLYIWYETLPDGRRHQRMTVGVALLSMPFFLAAHALTLLFGFPADGYSVPYAMAVLFSGLFYAGAGLCLLRKTLLDYFSPWVADATLLAIALGTNLFYYISLAGGYSHVYSFFLFALLTRLVLHSREFVSKRESLVMGLVFGLITLVRPTNVLIACIPMLYKLADLGSIAAVFRFAQKHAIHAFVAVCAILLVWLPQLVYWKYATGHWFFYSYHGERFFFSNPQVVNFLFSYRKGWLLYTPIMLFALLGMLLMYRRKPVLAIAFMVYTALHTTIASSWWIWWYGGGFGQRPMVETYALFAFPLAVFIEWAFEKKRLVRSATAVLFALLIFLNVFQTVQMRLGILHWDAMTKAAYWRCFMRLSRPRDLDLYLKAPDLGRAYEGHEELDL